MKSPNLVEGVIFDVRMKKAVHSSSFGFSRRRITSIGLERHKALYASPLTTEKCILGGSLASVNNVFLRTMLKNVFAHFQLRLISSMSKVYLRTSVSTNLR